MPHPYDTCESYFDGFDRREAEAERAQHRHDANRHLNEAPTLDPEQRLGVIRRCIEHTEGLIHTPGCTDAMKRLWVSLIADWRAEESKLVGTDREAA